MSGHETELLRLRDQYVELRRVADVLELELGGALHRLAMLERSVGELDKAAIVAAALAKQARRDRELVLTSAQKLAATIVGAVAIADFVLSLAGR